MSETIEERIARLEQIAIDTGEKVQEIKSTCESHRKETHADMNAIRATAHTEAVGTRNLIIGFMGPLIVCGAGAVLGVLTGLVG